MYKLRFTEVWITGPKANTEFEDYLNFESKEDAEKFLLIAGKMREDIMGDKYFLKNMSIREVK